MTSLCACSDLYAHTERTDAHAEYTYLANVQFVYHQHTHKELMHALSVRVRN
jgi:hypothetical protein